MFRASCEDMQKKVEMRQQDLQKEVAITQNGMPDFNDIPLSDDLEKTIKNIQREIKTEER